MRKKSYPRWFYALVFFYLLRWNRRWNENLFFVLSNLISRYVNNAKTIKDVYRKQINLSSLYLISDPTIDARWMISHACALLICLIFSLLIDTIKSPGCKSVSIVDKDCIQQPLMPLSTDASTAKSKSEKEISQTGRSRRLTQLIKSVLYQSFAFKVHGQFDNLLLS